MSYRMFSSISDLFLSEHQERPDLLQLNLSQSKMPPYIGKCPLGGKTVPAWK